MSVEDFVNELGLDLAVEEVGENPDLPEELLEQATVHYRADILRYDPYRSEHFVISGDGSILRPDPGVVLIALAIQMGLYRAFPEPADWCAAMGLPASDGIRKAWPTFARDEAKLMRIFGEDYARFLALDPRRG